MVQNLVPVTRRLWQLTKVYLMITWIIVIVTLPIIATPTAHLTVLSVATQMEYYFCGPDTALVP